jgi:glycosyltransferase involved in cell wall biosynthesis
MKVNFLIDSVFPGGTYFRAINLARALTNLGAQVQLFGIDYSPDAIERAETREGLPCHIVASCRGQRFFGQRHHPIVALHRSTKDYGDCDVVHMFEPFLATYLPWRKFSREEHSPQQWFDWADLWAGGGLLGTLPKWGFQERWEYYWADRIEAKAPKMATGMTVCSEWLADLATARGAKQTVLVHHGVWPAIPEPPGNPRRHLGLLQDVRYLGFMGRTISATEFSWCLEALRVAHRRCNTRLAICGPLDHLVQTIPKDLQTSVDYLGMLKPNECQAFASALDFALLPLEDTPFNTSRYPLKFSDYLAAGARVILSDVGECAEMAKTLNGVLLAEKGLNGWIAAVASAVDSLEAGTAASPKREEFEALLSWEKIAAKVLNAYQQNG